LEARHWAIVASLVATAKLNGVEPQAWLTDVLERMLSGRTKAHELERLLPWTWKAEQLTAATKCLNTATVRRRSPSSSLTSRS
jgi:transposase